MVPGCHQDHDRLRTAVSRGLGLAPQNIQQWSGSKDPTPNPRLASGQPAGTARTGVGGQSGRERGLGLASKPKDRRTVFLDARLLGWPEGLVEIRGECTFSQATPRPSHGSGKSWRPQKPPEAPRCCVWEALRDEALTCPLHCGSGRAELGWGAAPPTLRCWQQGASWPALGQQPAPQTSSRPKPGPVGIPEPSSQALRWLKQREF